MLPKQYSTIWYFPLVAKEKHNEYHLKHSERCNRPRGESLLSLKRSFAVVCFIVSICWAVTGVASSYSTVQSDILGALTQVLPLRGDYVPDLATVIISQNHIKPVKDEQGQWRYEAIIPLRRDL